MGGWRIVLLTHAPPVAVGMTQRLRELGHEVVAVLGARSEEPERVAALAAATPADVDFLVPASRVRIATLLATADADLGLCAGFPWRVPPEALAVPRLGLINIHPSALPRYRGPAPIAHALLNDEPELWITVHRMDADFDTGPVLAQACEPLGRGETPATIGDKMRSVVGEVLPRALERLASGEAGDAQDEAAASYAGLLGPEHEHIDWSRPAAHVHNQVLAWSFTVQKGWPVGDVDGRRLRIKATRLDPDDGAVRVECGDGPIWLVESEALSP